MSDQASLQLCNLLSRGLSMAEARKELATGDGGKGEKDAPAAPAPTHSGVPTTKEGLQEALKSRGIPFHPKAGLDKLSAIYKAEVLDKMPPADGEVDASATGGHSEPGDGTGE